LEVGSIIGRLGQRMILKSPACELRDPQDQREASVDVFHRWGGIPVQFALRLSRPWIDHMSFNAVDRGRPGSEECHKV
jgi:hypothetical protein